MSLTTKLQSWTTQNFLTKQQANLIQTYEQSRPTNLCFIFLKIFAGILVALGLMTMFCTSFTPKPIRIAFFVVSLLATSAGLFWSIKTKRSVMRELCITLSIIIEIALLGSIVILYHHAIDPYALSAILTIISLPYIVFSRSLILTFLWILLALTPLIPQGYAMSIKKWSIEHVYGFMVMSTSCALLAAGIRYVYKTLATYHLVILHALAVLVRIWAYLFLFSGALIWGLVECPLVLLMLIGKFSEPAPITAELFVFAFLIWQLIYACITFKANSFARNAVLVAIWIFILTATSFRVTSPIAVGILLIALGLGVLGIISLTKKLFAYLSSARAEQERLASSDLDNPTTV